MLERFFSRAPRHGVALTGAPSVRRLKSYSAQSGYVYQYYYEGQRPFSSKGVSGAEFVFSVSADRKSYTPVSVLVSGEALHDWEQRHNRVLVAAERYAIAKMALFQAFDERATPRDVAGAGISVRPADVDAILLTLDID